MTEPIMHRANVTSVSMTGNSTDTTVLYLITGGHGLAEALLPAVSPFDASINLPTSDRYEEK